MSKNRNRHNRESNVTQNEQTDETAKATETGETTEQPAVSTAPIAPPTPVVEEPTAVVAPPLYDANALMKEHGNKSKVMRYLASKGMKVGEIHKLLKNAGWKSDRTGDPIRYQHVRNVLNQPLVGSKTSAPAPAVQSVIAPATEQSEAA